MESLNYESRGGAPFRNVADSCSLSSRESLGFVQERLPVTGRDRERESERAVWRRTAARSARVDIPRPEFKGDPTMRHSADPSEGV